MKDKIFYGAKSLTMINSGTVNYLKLDLTMPLHLNAENNIGKTSTVNTLQFLYIDSMEDMFLPASFARSTDFYFRDEFSYLIFECVSKSGTYCVVLNRRRDSRKHYSRFVINAPFSKEFFIRPDSGSVRSWEEVLEFLDKGSIESYAVPNRHWWRVLSGLTDSKKSKTLPALFILPVKDEASYSRFKTIYRNLLSMSSIKLETFKDILLSCAVAAGEKRKIDFAEKDYRMRFEKAKALQLQYEFYIKNEDKIKHLIKLDSELNIFRKKIPLLFGEINASYHFYSKTLDEQINKSSCRIEEIKNEIFSLSETRDKIIGSLSEIALKTEQTENFIDEFQKLEKNADLAFYRDSFTLDELKEHKENELDRKFFILNEKLESISVLNKSSLAEQVGAIERELSGLKGVLESNILFCNYLEKNGVSKKKLDKLASVFRYELLAGSMEKTEIKDNSLLMENIDKIADSIEENILECGFLKMTLPDPYSLDSFSDREKVERKIVYLEEHLDELRQKYNLVTAHEDKLKELEELRRKRIHVGEVLEMYGKFCEMKSKLPEMEQALLDFDEKRNEFESKLKKIESHINDLKEEEFLLLTKNKENEDALKIIKTEFKRLYDTVAQHFPNLLSETDSETKNICELDFLIDEIPVFTHKIESLSADVQLVRMKKAEILEKAGLFYDRESDWTNFIDANADITAAAERVDKEWQTFFALAKHDFRTLVHCVDSVSALLKSVDRTFNKQKISNLASIKVSVVHKDIYEEAREFTLDSDDLFADPSKRRVYFGMFQKYFSNKYTDLRAEDLFHIKIEISNPNNPAESKNITSFDNESEGTNYTIKALLLSQLLKEQFKYGLYQENIVFHYYLDEIGQLDESNLSNIVQQNLEKNLLPITAAPRPVVDPMCHPDCRVVTLKEHPKTKRTYIAAENTFTATAG
jgi:hypothetical protein